MMCTKSQVMNHRSTVAQKGNNANKKVQHKQKSTTQTKQCNRRKQTKKYNANKKVQRKQKTTTQTKNYNANKKLQRKEKTATQTKNHNANQKPQRKQKSTTETSKNLLHREKIATICKGIKHGLHTFQVSKTKKLPGVFQSFLRCLPEVF